MKVNIVTANYGQGTVLALVTDVSGICCSICMSLGRWGSTDDSSACWEKFLCAARLFQSCPFTKRQNLTLRYVSFLHWMWILSKIYTLGPSSWYEMMSTKVDKYILRT